MVKVAELLGHTERVLHTSLSPDGSTLVSAGADETLRLVALNNRIFVVSRFLKIQYKTTFVLEVQLLLQEYKQPAEPAVHFLVLS